MKSYYYLFSILLLLSIQNFTNAQNPKWVSYSKVGGIRATADDGNFIWIGTGYGLVKMNKSTGEKTHYNTCNSPLKDNSIASVAIDNDGYVWLVTGNNCIAKFDGLKWSLYNSFSSTTDIRYYSSTIAIDNKGNKWFGFGNIGLKMFDGKVWTDYKYSYSKYNSEGGIKSIAFDKEGNQWFSTEWELSKFDGKNWTYFMHNNSGLPIYTIRSIAIDNEGNKWICTAGGGLVKFDDVNWTIYNTSNSGIVDNNILKVFSDKSGNIWIVDSKSNLIKFDKKNWSVVSNMNSLVPDYINKAITTFLIDSSGNKWIGYNCESICKFNDTNWTVFNCSNSILPDNQIKAISVDRNNRTWIGTYWGVNCVDGTNWSLYNESNSGVSLRGISSIAADSSNTIWVGTYTNGLFKFDGSNWTKHSSIKYINSILIDYIGNKWVGSFDGLYKFDGNNWVNYRDVNSQLNGFHCSKMVFDYDWNLWITSDYDFIKLDLTNSKVFTSASLSFPNFYPNSEVSQIAAESNGNIWVGKRGSGLVKFDGTNWTAYNTTNSSLPSNNVSAIVLDDYDNKWIGTDSGLVKYDGTNWTVYNTSNSGIAGNDVYTLAVDKKGKIWIGTSYNGISVFDEKGDAVNVKNEISAVPENYSLAQNYPNPFNPSTVIYYQLKTAEFVTLKVYDVLGREVALLVNGYQTAGTHTVNFNAAGLSSGIYIYTIKAGDKLTQSKKMILIR